MQLDIFGNFEIKVVSTREVELAPELPGMCFTPVPFPIFLEKNEHRVGRICLLKRTFSANRM